MPSTSLQRWNTDRMSRLGHLDAQCAASLAAASPNPQLIDENLRGYVVLLSAHFQGFCRDLSTEATQAIVSRVRPTLQVLIQAQFSARCALDHGNPNLENLRKDFQRIGPAFQLHAAFQADPANALRLQHLAALNEWRNIAAHHGTIPPTSPLNLPLLQTWRLSCDGLATSLDGIVYNQVKRTLRRQPWPP
jgi:hypothetical protein